MCKTESMLISKNVLTQQALIVTSEYIYAFI